MLIEIESESNEGFIKKLRISKDFTNAARVEIL